LYWFGAGSSSAPVQNIFKHDHYSLSFLIPDSILYTEYSYKFIAISIVKIVSNKKECEKVEFAGVYM